MRCKHESWSGHGCFRFVFKRKTFSAHIWFSMRAPRFQSVWVKFVQKPPELIQRKRCCLRCHSLFCLLIRKAWRQCASRAAWFWEKKNPSNLNVIANPNWDIWYIWGIITPRKQQRAHLFHSGGSRVSRLRCKVRQRCIPVPVSHRQEGQPTGPARAGSHYHKG